MPKTLLLADDSVTIQKVVGISFANEDVVLLTVDNGDDAIRKAREARPDVVLADVVMPGKSGYEVCEAVKTDSDLAGVPVLLLTGTFEAFDEDRARSVGADGHITKPFEAQALVDQVNALLARSATAAPPAAAAVATPSPDESLGLPAQGPAGSYEFFDDDPTAPSPAPRAPQVSQPEPEPATSAEDLGLGDSGGQSFRFDTDTAPDLGAGLPEAPHAAMPAAMPGNPDETQVLSAVPDVADTSFQSFGSSDLADSQAPTRHGEPEAEPIFDALDPEAETGAPVAATLDPDRAGAYDVSSTDLGPLVAEATSPAPPQSPPPIPSGEDTVLVMEPLVSPEPPPVPVPVPAAAPPPPPPPIQATPEPVAAPFAETPPSAAAHEISPAVRDEIRSALEKVAWEAFGRVTESVVKDAVERIEKVAWEVVPQLAETLVKEEIRRLKGDD